MFNLLVALCLGLIIGWSLHSFFIQLNEPNILNNKMSLTMALEKNSSVLNSSPLKKVMVKTDVKDKNIKEITQKVIPPIDAFSTLLDRGLFSDAIAIYLKSSKKNLPLYHSKFLNYFKTKSLKEPSLAIQEMLKFSEIEPEHYQVSLLLVEIYERRENFKEAIGLIVELIESNFDDKVKELNQKLINSSQKYIKSLKKSNEIHTLIVFLEEQIELGIQTPFYTYTLAEHYIKLKKYLLATELLKELEFDENYGEKSKNLLVSIEKKRETNKEYDYALPLNKEGEHFTIDVTIEDTPLTLLLDTGATLTVINEEKISSLEILNENIMLNTAGGEINAQLKQADSLKVGGLEIMKFQVISSPFQQENADGLLGMNFFKKFKFKINQEEEVLYLSRR